MLLSQFIRSGAAALEALYPPREARSLVLRLCEDMLGVDSYTHIVEPSFEVPADSEPALCAALERLASGEPLQYVTGWQEFCGRRFTVGPDVLIPRPETELLVQEALGFARGMGGDVRVLDLCTGSGCIAWTLALELPGASVTAVDISETALEIARHQFSSPAGIPSPGASLRSSLPRQKRGPLPFTWPRAATVPGDGIPAGEEKDGHGPEFVRMDVLELPDEMPGAPFDIIVANPPYICEKEKAAMHRNVLIHEPAIALFVPDDDPLVFYRAIAAWALRFLRSGGWGIVEINETLGGETLELFLGAGLEKVRKISDFFGKDRFVSFQKVA